MRPTKKLDLSQKWEQMIANRMDWAFFFDVDDVNVFLPLVLFLSLNCVITNSSGIIISAYSLIFCLAFEKQTNNFFCRIPNKIRH